MKSMIYVGNDERLLGEKALVQEFDSKFHAQFNSMHLPESLNWHEFDKKDFMLIEDLKEQKNFINSLYEQCPDLEKDGLKEFDGYFMTYDRFLKRFETATGEKPNYCNDPLELIIDLINKYEELLEK